MSSHKKSLLVALAFLSACGMAASGYNPPSGGFLLPSLFTPWALSARPTTTGPAAPWASEFNPAALADSKLYQLEGGYTGITDFGAAGQGWGSAASVAFVAPVPFGVWEGQAKFFSSPASMSEMPLGTFGALRVAMAKQLSTLLDVGAGFELAMGGKGGFGWGASLDLGAKYAIGNLFFLKDASLGVSLLDIGKGYLTPGASGVLDPSSPASSYPSAFTFGAGVSGALLQGDSWRIEASADLWSPSFQDLDLDLSVRFAYRDWAELRLGWSAGLRDALAGTGRNYLPSIGISGTIPLAGPLTLGKTAHKDLRLSSGLALAPLYDSLYGMGAGFNVSFGLIDRTAPRIQAELPVPFRGITYISPNGDGVLDRLEIPVTISDERYIARWEMKIEDKSSGKVVRTQGDSIELPNALPGISSIFKAFGYKLSNVKVPEVLIWDGKDDSGAKVPDGPYTVSIRASDDLGNENVDYMSCMTVVVDGRQPQAATWPLDASLIFSPDGDGQKDGISFRNTGSVESEWTIEVADASGTAVRRIVSKDRSAPKDFTWDGTSDSGSRVPDGTYSYKISTKDDAGNKASGEVANIVVNTARPVVSISTDDSVMSPNGDGVRDSLKILPLIASTDGVEAWKVFVLDGDRKEVWSVAGGSDRKPESSYSFGGFSQTGTALADGQYEAGIEMRYVNGYKPQRLSAPFYLDKTPPKASVEVADVNRIFSPDGDASRDSISFRMASSEEESWNLIIRDGSKNEVVVKRFAQNLPESFEWNGRDDQGRVAQDGNYELFVFSVDKAGNSFSTVSPRVTVDTRRPKALLATSAQALSPNGDGIAESVTLQPVIGSAEGLVSWRIAIENQESKAVVFSAQGAEGNPPAEGYSFDGTSKEGAALPEGFYRAVLDVAYVNGYTARVTGDPILLDRTYPSAKVSIDKAVFNPAGRPDQATIRFAQKSSSETKWTARILDSTGKAVRTWDFEGELAAIEWNGSGDYGLPVPDGTYRYKVSSTDGAGNAFATPELAFEIDTLKKESSISTGTLAFSPNGDGVRDVLPIRLQSTQSSKIHSWKIVVAKDLGDSRPGENARRAPVKTWTGTTGFPGELGWDGKEDNGLPAQDGTYLVYMTASYPNGDLVEANSPSVLLDRVAPSARATVSAPLFSPNGDGVLDSVTFVQSAETKDTWLGTLSSASGETLRTWKWTGDLADLSWAGDDESGGILPDGAYTYELSSADSAGNRYSSGLIPVRIETEKKAVRLDIDQRAFSPNGDGVRDVLTLGATVQAPERVKEYELRIVAQEGPLTMTAVRTWKGSAIPQKFTWSGETDSGPAAPDGRYAAGMTVRYTNGDEVDAATPYFTLDRVFPSIETKASLSIFSPNGDGRSDLLEISQRSAAGDDWTGTITASDGQVVRNYTWKGEATSFVWDGKDETGAMARDGQYRYVAVSSDQAGNRTQSRELFFSLENEKKTVRLDIDLPAFSPNDDGIKDLLVVGVAAQFPERISSYELGIYPASSGSSLPVRVWKGSVDVRTAYAWDGTTEAGIPVPDGLYKARLTVLYRNDDSFQRETGSFLLDRVAPKATVSLSPAVISPNGDGRSDVLRISQESVAGDDWQGLIISSANRIVRTWNWKNKVESFEWDGRDLAGLAIQDGQYRYELRSIDQAGNSFASAPISFGVDGAKKTVRLEVDQTAFSPNGDGIKDLLFINIQAPRPENVLEYQISVSQADSAGAPQGVPVRQWRGSRDLMDHYEWDGRTDSGIRAPDGSYVVVMRILYDNDDLFQAASKPIGLDTVAPSAQLAVDPLVFSPNGDGNKDQISIRQTSVQGDDWTGRIRNASGSTIRTWGWKQAVASFVWDGKDATGAIVRDGVYSYELEAQDSAGNRTVLRQAGITVDATRPKVYVTASDTGMSPNGDGIRDEVSFAITVERREGIESWRFSLVDRQGLEKSYFGGSGGEVPARLVWDGRDLQGQVVQGEYVGKLMVRYTKGDLAEAASTPVLVDVDPPKVEISVIPEYFSPDGDGEGDTLQVGIGVDAAAGIVEWKLEVFETAIVESSTPNAVKSERLFMEWSGKGKPPARISWNGISSRGELVESATDYPFSFVARDQLGNTTTVSGFIAVDVLVIRDGDRLKIKVPSIVFRANYADFVGLGKDIVDRNEKVIERIAQILNKFPDYRIRIEGHANNIGKMLGYSSARIQAEETKELVPLSTGRAELVRSMLVQNGVDSRRLSVEGKGSSEPVVSFTDVENRWKNRRVEFVLIKNQ